MEFLKQNTGNNDQYGMEAGQLEWRQDYKV